MIRSLSHQLFPGTTVVASGDTLAALALGEDRLSDEERHRSSRLIGETGRRAFQARRIFLRETLAGRLGMAPREVALVCSATGKPELRDSGHVLWFSQSSTPERSVVVLSDFGPVGVDIEAVDRPLPHHEMSRRLFSSEEHQRVQAARSEPESRLEFLRIWTAREAVVKLTGQGMADGLDRWETQRDPSRIRSTVDARTYPAETRVEAGHVITVVWDGDDWRSGRCSGPARRLATRLTGRCARTQA